MARKRIPEIVPPRVLLEFSMRALANAENLAADAHLLADKQRWPRAVALLVLAREELGKAYYAWLLSIGAIEEKPDSISVLLSAHSKKHALGYLPDWPWLVNLMTAALEGISLPDVELDLSTDAGKRSYEELLGRIAGRLSLAKVDLRDVATSVDEMQVMWSDLVDKRRLDRLRQQALFVDISEDGLRVLDPEVVTRDQYAGLRLEYESTYSRVRGTMPDHIEGGWLEQIRAVMECNREAVKKSRESEEPRPGRPANPPSSIPDDSP